MSDDDNLDTELAKMIDAMHDRDAEALVPNLAIINKIGQMVLDYGHMVVAVGPERGGVPFAYTVGLALSELPELAVYGLPAQFAQFVLNHAADHLREEGIPLGHPLGGVATVPLYPVLMSDVSDLRIARHCIQDDAAVLALQLVWPDAEGKYPWEGSVAAEFQPVKGEPSR